MLSLKKRDSRLELLRIVAAFMILAHHAVQHGGLVANSFIQAPISVNQIWCTVIGCWGQLGVTVFVLISSWFLIEKQGGISISKAIGLGVTSWGYGIFIMAFVLFLDYSIPKSIAVKCLMGPIYPSGYWFVSTFIVFFLIVPILRNAVKHMSKNGLFYISVVGGFLIPVYNFFFENVGGTLAYFCYLFFLCGFFKSNEQNFAKKYRYVLFSLSSLLTIGLVVLGSFVSSLCGGGALSQLLRIYDTQNIITVIQGVSLFYIFLELKPFSSNLVNQIAKTAFGTYLITENIVIRGDSNYTSVLWNDFFSFAKMYEQNTFVFYSSGAILLVFICVILIDYCRLKLSDLIKPRIKLMEKLDQWGATCFEDKEPGARFG